MVNENKGKIKVLKDKGSRRFVESGQEKTDLKLQVGCWLVGSLVCCFVVVKKKKKKTKKKKKEKKKKKKKTKKKKKKKKTKKKKMKHLVCLLYTSPSPRDA